MMDRAAYSPLPLRERVPSAARRVRGRGRSAPPPHPPTASRRAPPSPAEGEGLGDLSMKDVLKIVLAIVIIVVAWKI